MKSHVLNANFSHNRCAKISTNLSDYELGSMQHCKVKTTRNSTVRSSCFLSVLCSQRSKMCWRTCSSSSLLCHETRDILCPSVDRLNAELCNPRLLSAPAEDAVYTALPVWTTCHHQRPNWNAQLPRVGWCHPYSPGFQTCATRVWRLRDSDAIAWDHAAPHGFDSGRQQRWEGYGRPTKKGKAWPDPSFQAHPPPLSLSLHPPLGCLGYSSVTSGGYWGVKLKSGRSCTPHSRPYATNTGAFQHTQTPERFVGFGMGPLGVIMLANAYRVLWLS